jgi:hypothetical protein
MILEVRMGRVVALHTGLRKACEALTRAQGANRSACPAVRSELACAPICWKTISHIYREENGRGRVEARGEASLLSQARVRPLPAGRVAIVEKVRPTPLFPRVERRTAEFAEARRKIARLHELNEIETIC